MRLADWLRRATNLRTTKQSQDSNRDFFLCDLMPLCKLRDFWLACACVFYDVESIREKSPGVFKRVQEMLLFQVDGGAHWLLNAKQLEIWTDLYPELDVEQECRKAWAWLDANPGKRKTARGMKRFLVGWLNRVTPVPKETGEQADSRGHVPPCESWMACNERVLAEARAKRTA